MASSFAYATARDWARLGELYLHNGYWNGQSVIPEDYVEFAKSPTPGSSGHYGGGQLWLNPASVSVAEYNAVSQENKEHEEAKKRHSWISTTLPPDSFMFTGHQGQYVVIIPSKKLVISRLGFTKTPSTWSPKKFFSGILRCIE